MKSRLCVALVLFAASSPAWGQPIILGTEDPANGFVGTIPGTSIQVGSDGESGFFPFNIPVDVSDAVSFDMQPFPWDIDPSTTGWTNLVAPDGTPTHTWYIDAGSVGENEPPVPEPIGLFVSPNPWVPDVIGTYWILGGTNEPGEHDEITLFNGADGRAYLAFNSDAPEPTTICLLGLGIAAMTRRARRRTAKA